MFNVRELNPTDAEAWAALRKESLELHPLSFSALVPDDPRALVDVMLQRLKDSGTKIFGAFHDESLVGMVGLRRIPGPKEGHKVFIWGMYVTARSRRGGAGALLLHAAIQEARTWSGVEQIHLSVSSQAEEARRLYERHGFLAWGCEPRAVHWAGRYTDEIHMTLDLRDGDSWLNPQLQEGPNPARA
jgi:RimJ/RimL family protein N-acetyltransferase